MLSVRRSSLGRKSKSRSSKKRSRKNHAVGKHNIRCGVCNKSLLSVNHMEKHMSKSHKIYRTPEVKRRNYLLYLLGAGLLVGGGIAYFMLSGDDAQPVIEQVEQPSVTPTANEPQLTWDNFSEPFLGIGGSFIDGANDVIDQSLNLLSDGEKSYVSTSSSRSGFTTASGGSFV